MTMSDARRALNDRAILEIWDRGDGQTPAERALTILSAAGDGRERDAEKLTAGARDAELVRLYAQTFGERVTALARCTNCGELLDLSFDLSTLQAGCGDTQREWRVSSRSAPAYDIRFRLPSSTDLAHASRAASAAEARADLLERCVISAEREGAPVQPRDLPEDVVAVLGQAMAEHDPQSDLLLGTTCPACRAEQDVTFDIVQFMWSEIAARARQVLVNVHSLALAYGWSEADILALPRARRAVYLGLLEE
ncbi:MAG: hypothetical protein ACM3JD_02390 [Rudaea sp.]